MFKKFFSEVNPVVWLIFLTFLFLFPWNGNWKVIAWDAFGYYLYLPQIFIYHDPFITNYEAIRILVEKYQISTTFYQVHEIGYGKFISQYPIGMALFFLPAFLVGHLWAMLFGYELNGLSAPYEWSLLIGYFVMLFSGLVILDKLLKRFFSKKLISVLLICLAFGTNYFYQGLYSIPSPHIYLFVLNGLFVLLTLKEIKHHSDYFILGLLLGFITLIRVTDFVIILFPICLFMYPVSGKRLYNKVFSINNLTRGMIFIIGLMLVVSLQLFFWKWITGKFFYYSYKNPGEGFDFLHPNTIQFLFSFRKGWFIYTPMALLFLAGFYPLKKERPELFNAIIIYLIIVVYIASSWSCWWYGGGFSQRTMVQTYPLLLIPFGYFLQYRNRFWYSFILGVFIFGFIILNLFQTWQLRSGIIKPSQMTYSYYVKTIGKTRIPEGAELDLLVDRSLDGKDRLDTRLYKLAISRTYYFQSDSLIESTQLKKAEMEMVPIVLGSNYIYSKPITLPFNLLTNKTDHSWIQINFQYRNAIPEQNRVKLVLRFINRYNEPYDYKAIDLKDFSTHGKDSIYQFSYAYITPEVRNTSDNFSLFFWDTGSGSLTSIDSVQIETYIRK